MTHTYKVTGMTCTGCEEKVKRLLEKVNNVTEVRISRDKEEVAITMSQHIPTAQLQTALKDYPKYQLSEKHVHMPVDLPEENKTWFQTYKPVILIFAYITIVTLLIQYKNDSFHWMQWMNHFMAGFFLTFSFFKLLNLQGFSDSYSTYDIIAKRWPFYGKIYAFIELALGLAYLTAFRPGVTNAVTFIVMSISLIGVLQSVLDKRKIRCACLGDVFNLPMSTITILEDALMIVMSAAMLIQIL
jgi:copper chaperone CopZ